MWRALLFLAFLFFDRMFAAGVRHAARLVAGWKLAPKEKERP